MAQILYVIAMEKEATDIAKKMNMKLENNIYTNGKQDLIISGIGKQRTAIALTKYLLTHEKPQKIINIGYAGSTDLKIGSWATIEKSYNYEWYIPGEEQYSMSDYGNQKLLTIPNVTKVNCYSAESFATTTNLKGHIAFDMELHSIALICDKENIPLISLKKISDNLSLEKYYETTNTNLMELVSGLELLKNIENEE